VLHRFWINFRLSNSDSTSEVENRVHQTQLQCLVRLGYIWEVAWCPRGRHSWYTYPLPFIPLALRSYCRFGDCFSKFTPLDPVCSAHIGSPLVGCGSSQHTDCLGWREAIYLHLRPLGNNQQLSSSSPLQLPDSGTVQPIPLDPYYYCIMNSYLEYLLNNLLYRLEPNIPSNKYLYICFSGHIAYVSITVTCYSRPLPSPPPFTALAICVICNYTNQNYCVILLPS